MIVVPALSFSVIDKKIWKEDLTDSREKQEAL